MSELTLVKSVMYSGDLIGITILSLVGDAMGRKSLIIICQIIMMIGLLVTIFSFSLWMGGIGMFCCILTSKIAQNICFTMIYEIVAPKYAQSMIIVVAVVCCFD